MASIEAKPKNCNKIENCEIKNVNKSRTTYDTVVVHLLSYVWLFVIPWTAACHNSMSFTISQSLLKFMSTESVMPSNHLILCPLPLLSSIFPSIRVFSNESALHIRQSRYWSFSFRFSISPSNEYSGLISFRMDWLDLLTVQGTLKSLNSYIGTKFLSSIHWLISKRNC